MSLLNDSLPDGMRKSGIQYCKRLIDVRANGPQQLELIFDDGTTDHVNAV
ncbi:hypothetical protein BGW36DRAFT_442610 [Talaromyces proteolyticus]|uniref:Uncharacterized protein n=1 Tax=Talaromyces proteolyticus TaxID=1131652 RepID=A0AAD4KDX1_9EURO|nr:uncharacterized protein BGW36DRAFT_442610 [Talaromyces proteolyticus]KAH8688724.1 hypothetical protein BGW36DRAFT_442610 [Talaromyces proteolyticus]